MAKENRIFKFDKQIKTQKQQQVSGSEDRVCGSEYDGTMVVVAPKMMVKVLKKRQRTASKNLATRES